ncbi:MAG: hypothetical protein J5J06_05475 [Phycisphaerae bacterium]|nr:hypothetical protein [Phycisphaerae bacterium]
MPRKKQSIITPDAWSKEDMFRIVHALCGRAIGSCDELHIHDLLKYGLRMEVDRKRLAQLNLTDVEDVLRQFAALVDALRDWALRDDDGEFLDCSTVLAEWGFNLELTEDLARHLEP